MRITLACPATEDSVSAAVATAILRVTAILGLLSVAFAVVAYVAMYTAVYAQPDTTVWYQALPPWMSFSGLLVSGFVLLRQAALRRWACRAGTVLAWLIAAYAVAEQIAHPHTTPLAVTGLCVAVAVLLSWAAVAHRHTLRGGI